MQILAGTNEAYLRVWKGEQDLDAVGSLFWSRRVTAVNYGRVDRGRLWTEHRGSLADRCVLDGQTVGRLVRRPLSRVGRPYDDDGEGSRGRRAAAAKDTLRRKEERPNGRMTDGLPVVACHLRCEAPGCP